MFIDLSPKPTPKEIWEQLKKDTNSLRGNHEVLKYLFADLDAEYFAIASDGIHFITRNVNVIKGEKKVHFYVYTKVSYAKTLMNSVN